jgi:hypothetical protein
MSVLKRRPELPGDVRVYCIVLKDSERVEALRDELEREDLLEYVEWVERERDAADGVRGCFQSHQAVCAAALEHDGVRAVVIIEDDCVFEPARVIGSVLDGLRDAISAARGGVSAVAVGGMPVRPMRGYVQASLWCRYVSWRWTHCYVLSRAGAAWVKALRYSGRHYDQVLAHVPGRTAILVPTIAFQRSDVGTTTGASRAYRALTHARNVLSARTCQKFMERFMLLLSHCVRW